MHVPVLMAKLERVALAMDPLHAGDRLDHDAPPRRPREELSGQRAGISREGANEVWWGGYRWYPEGETSRIWEGVYLVYESRELPLREGLDPASETWIDVDEHKGMVGYVERRRGTHGAGARITRLSLDRFARLEPREVAEALCRPPAVAATPVPQNTEVDNAPLQSWEEAVEAFRRQYLLNALARHDGNRSVTARALGVDPRTVFRYLEQKKDG